MPRPAWVRGLSIPTPFPVGPVNSWLILKDPVTLIDAGPLTDEAAAVLEAALAEAGVEPARILLTHGHHDHFGAAGRLASKSPRLEVLGSPRDGHHFRKDRDTGRLREGLSRSGLPPEIHEEIVRSIASIDRFAAPIQNLSPLSGGETLPGDGWRVEVLSTPGHTPGSLSFRVLGDDGTDLVATGDTILERITPNAVVDIDPDDPARIFSSVSRHVRALEAIGDIGADEVLTGHGRTIVDYDLNHDYQKSRRGLRRRQMLGHLSTGRALSAWEMMRKMFPKVDRLEFFLAYSEVIGHLLWLEELGEVTRILEGGVEQWQAPAEIGNGEERK